MNWLEASGFGEWVLGSYVGYPLMIASHAVGMAIMVGIALALEMRLLGWFRGIPYAALNRFLGIAWAGFALNFLSGTGLFATQATTYVTDITFLLKMGFVISGMALTGVMQSAINRNSSGWSATAAPGNIRMVAIASIVCWVGGAVTGRLIAYL